MDEIEIKKHDFEQAKNRLKEFSEKTEAELEIDKVRTEGGLFGWSDHKVTGYELNRRLETIQRHFIAVNTTNNKVIKELLKEKAFLQSIIKSYCFSFIVLINLKNNIGFLRNFF